MRHLGLPLPREELEVLFFTLKWEDFQVNSSPQTSMAGNSVLNPGGIPGIPCRRRLFPSITEDCIITISNFPKACVAPDRDMYRCGSVCQEQRKTRISGDAIVL